MKKYDSYKDSGIEWIGEIPSHWGVKKLKHVAKINPTKNQSYKDYEDEVVFLPMEKVKEDGSFEDDITKPINELWKGYTYFEKGDIILAKITPCFENGKGALLSNLKTNFGFGSTEFHVIRANISKPDHLFYVTRSHIFMAIGEAFMTGAAGQKRVPSDFVSEFIFPLPSKKEQTSIASFLDRKTSEIDDIIADKKRLLELYEEEKTAIINQAVTKGLDPNAPMKDSGIEWLGEIPEHWEAVKLKYIAKIQTGRTPKIQNSKIDYFENGTINWFTPSDMDGSQELVNSKRSIIIEAVENDEVELFSEYSIFLVSIGATLGKVGFSKEQASANQQINVITFFDKVFDPIFGYYYIVGNKEMITLQADYTTLPILNQSKTKDLLFSFPPIQEQQSIVHHIESECSKIDFKKARTEELIELLTEYRTALISEVVTGKIKVTED